MLVSIKGLFAELCGSGPAAVIVSV
ncbi:MAG: hypothetical protein METHSR3v1_1820003, partial [Methanothrix sp.]